MADGMVLLPKVSVGEAGATSGSREKVMRRAPGSVATVGFTGAVKWKTSRGGLSADNDAVKWVATLPMKRRPDSSCRVTGPPRNRGSREASAVDGDEPAIIFQQKSSDEIGVASLHPGARLADLEIAFHIVVAQAPARAV